MSNWKSIKAFASKKTFLDFNMVSKRHDPFSALLLQKSLSEAAERTLFNSWVVALTTVHVAVVTVMLTNSTMNWDENDSDSGDSQTHVEQKDIGISCCQFC